MNQAMSSQKTSNTSLKPLIRHMRRLMSLCYCNEYKERFCLYHKMYGWVYRTLMKVAHKYNWHYAPLIYGVDFNQRWCQWCGFRETFKTWPESKPINQVSTTETTN